MKQAVNVIGTGYIGSLVALQAADTGHEVLCVDKNEMVLDTEHWFSRYNDLDRESNTKRLEKIESTTDCSNVEGKTSIVCVNTPEQNNEADLSNLKAALRDLSSNIEEGHHIILRSTVPPSTSESELIPLIEDLSGLNRGEDFKFCYSPEFIRGGSGLQELKEPSKVVVAGDTEAIESYNSIFPEVENSYRTDIRSAEAVKYFDNVFHGLKVSIANECGRLGSELGFDPSKVMEIISSDTLLNISDVYMNPGAPFGGPCLEKDIQALDGESRKARPRTPVLSSINQSNMEHLSWIVQKIEQAEASSVGLIGATYKPGFDSTVKSPCLRGANLLEPQFEDVLIYDPLVNIEDHKQVGADKIEEADILVVFNKVDGFSEIRESYTGKIIDVASFSL